MNNISVSYKSKSSPFEKFPHKDTLLNKGTRPQHKWLVAKCFEDVNK